MVRVESNVHAVPGSNTNWVIVKDGDSCTLVDTGSPGQRDAVPASLEAIGLNARPWPPCWSRTRRTTTTSVRPNTCAPRTAYPSSCTGTRCPAGSTGPARRTCARAHTGTHQRTLRLSPARSGILITSDALVSAHPTSRISGPQPLPDMFPTDRAWALDSLAVIGGVDAGILLPGHGPAHHGSAKEAALGARQRVAR